MSASREKILGLVASGKISAKEGETLLDALEGPRHGLFTRLFLGAETLPLGRALALGLVGFVASLGLTRARARFDGAFDVHTVEQSVPLTQSLIDLLVAWSSLALTLWIASWLFARRGRLVDFFGFVGVARLPLVLLAATGLFIRDVLPTASSEATTWGGGGGLLLAVLVLLPALALNVALLFRGFRVASGLRGGRVWAPFLIAILAAEALSKAVLQLLS